MDSTVPVVPRLAVSIQPEVCVLIVTDTRGEGWPRKTDPDLDVCGSGGGARTHDLRSPDHRNLSETFTWTPRTRGFKDVCLSRTPVSDWWCAFCPMMCILPNEVSNA
jgi:hypothetical protein